MVLKQIIRLILLIWWLSYLVLAAVAIVDRDPLRNGPGTEPLPQRFASAAICAALALPAWIIWKRMRPALNGRSKSADHRENP